MVKYQNHVNLIIKTILEDWKNQNYVKNKEMTENISYSLEEYYNINGNIKLELKYYNTYHNITGHSTDKSFANSWLKKIFQS
jgi:hypothetical protein